MATPAYGPRLYAIDYDRPAGVKIVFKEARALVPGSPNASVEYHKYGDESQWRDAHGNLLPVGFQP